MAKIIKAISMWEPHASLVRTGAKTIETRGWKTNYRGELLICAAAAGISMHELGFLLCCGPIQEGLAPLIGSPRVKIEHLNFGKAVALVDLYDCIPMGDLTLKEYEPEKHFGNFSLGRFAWKMKLLDGSFEPFPVKGRQGFFNVDIGDTPWS